MKKILGLDLGTTSIGWAFVSEAENEQEQSIVHRIGVRVNPLTTDEQKNFEKGKPVSVNADRTLKRGARRSLQRYKLRRAHLVKALLQAGIITKDTLLAEDGKDSTHSTYALRAKAATGKIANEDLGRVLLMLNKKRGYRSSRKVKNEEEGQAIDGMTVAKQLYEEGITPGQLCYRLLKAGKKTLPDFYRSDLQDELDKVWNCQKQFYPEIFTDAFKKDIEGKGRGPTSAAFWNKYGFNTADIKGTREEKKLTAYEWRSKATDTQLGREEAAYVIAEINNNMSSSSGYLGAISDRSKELYFNRQTVGQYLYAQLQQSPHTRLKNQVFYRQDYLDEFNIIWETQSQYHPELTPALKEDIRDMIIFYQRKLKSQKGLVSFCEFECKKVEIEKDGKTVTKLTGYKVAPKSSPLFQQFKIWQNLHDLRAQNKATKEILDFDQEAKESLFEELNTRGTLTADKALSLLGYKPKEWELNFKAVQGNMTNKVLYEAYLKILELEGYDVKELFKVKGDKDDVTLADITVEPTEIKKIISSVFDTLKIDTAILDFNAELDGKDFERQASYRLWHLLYAYEGDNSPSGNETLWRLLGSKFGFAQGHAKILSNIALPDDYGSLSAKAMRNIYPFIKESEYSIACKQAGYNHSSSITKEENENRELKTRLELLPRNSLRNPVVEKILNQMVNVVNAIIDDPELGKPDEVRIELARELKKNAKEREEMTASIAKANAEHERIRNLLIKEDGIKNPTRNDIIRYKLYHELKNNGYKTLYSNTYIPRERLFTKDFDIEHIIPQALLFDDSFSNKTICVRQENLDKGNKCAFDFIGPYFGEDKIEAYKERIEMLYRLNQKNDGEGISKAKYKKLLMKAEEIGKGFIERDLRDSQYIAKKAKEMFHELCKNVVTTTGSITARLREDWGLTNIMQELNMEKYRRSGLTEMRETKDGNLKERITDWSKRNDHRHHAMDALTVAFTRRQYIQYLNHLNARKNEQDEWHGAIMGIEKKYTTYEFDDAGNKKRRFKLPVPNFREVAKEQLEHVLVSYKAKNKVATKNVNRYRTAKGERQQVVLTPRGQLHKETVYGKIRRYATREEKVGAKFDEALIQQVTVKAYREALLKRLRENNGDPKKAFTGKNSLEKTPLYINETAKLTVPPKVKLMVLEDNYTIRKEVTPDNFKDKKSIEKIIDAGVRRLLLERFEASKDAKEAFSNLDKNPLWLNEAKGIAIKSVKISGVSNAEALHHKRDHNGELIPGEHGNSIPADFVSTGNNHHVAVYRDADGKLQDTIISFYEAVERVRQGLPVIDRTLNKELGWQFLFTMKQNELFLFPSDTFDPNEIDLLNLENYKQLSANLFRVQKLSKLSYGNATVREYVFRHHLETTVDDKKELKDIAYKELKSLSLLDKIVKVRLNHIGRIVKVGEY